MQVVLGWQGLAVLGIVVMAVWGLWWVLADLLLDRIGSPAADWSSAPDHHDAPTSPRS